MDAKLIKKVMTADNGNTRQPAKSSDNLREETACEDASRLMHAPSLQGDTSAHIKTSSHTTTINAIQPGMLLRWLNIK